MVELRDGSDNTRVVAREPGLIQADGDIVAPDGSVLVFEGIEEGNYYV